MLRLIGMVVACGLAAAGCGVHDSADQRPAPTKAGPAPVVGAFPGGETPASAAFLSADGWGAVKIGMTEAEAVEALGGATPEGHDPMCRHLRPTRGPEGLAVMILKGRVSRVSLYEDGPVRTDRGLGLGVTEAQVRAAYGEILEVQPHHYDDPPAKYLTWWRVPGESGVRYETDAQGRVTAIHGGDASIRFVEGCS